MPHRLQIGSERVLFRDAIALCGSVLLGSFTDPAHWPLTKACVQHQQPINYTLHSGSRHRRQACQAIVLR